MLHVHSPRLAHVGLQCLHEVCRPQLWPRPRHAQARVSWLEASGASVGVSLGVVEAGVTGLHLVGWGPGHRGSCDPRHRGRGHGRRQGGRSDAHAGPEVRPRVWGVGDVSVETKVGRVARVVGGGGVAGVGRYGRLRHTPWEVGHKPSQVPWHSASLKQRQMRRLQS